VGSCSRASEGFNRWRLSLEQSQVKNSASLVAAITNELELIKTQLRALRKAGRNQVDRQAQVAQGALELYQAVADMYVLERDTIQIVAGSAQLAQVGSTSPNALKVSRMSDVLLMLAETTAQHAAVLKSDVYSALSLEAALVAPVEFELGVAEMWTRTFWACRRTSRSSGAARRS
jgi:hypothetical protein